MLWLDLWPDESLHDALFSFYRAKDELNKLWLKKNGLAAKKMTLMDALGSTVVRQKRKYVAIIDKHVLSKVFEDVSVCALGWDHKGEISP